VPLVPDREQWAVNPLALTDGTVHTIRAVIDSDELRPVGPSPTSVAFSPIRVDLGGSPVSATPSERPATPDLDRFVRQWAVALTTFRRDGTPVPTPVSIAVDGDRAVFRSFQKAGKSRRLRRDPHVEVAPSTWRGRSTGPAIKGTARLLDGADDRRAAQLLRRKHPLLHGVLVPLAHRVGRAKTGRTIHFELIPEREP
jgi:PPOX class probable F420-dependent enzyme